MQVRHLESISKGNLGRQTQEPSSLWGGGPAKASRGPAPLALSPSFFLPAQGPVKCRDENGARPGCTPVSKVKKHLENAPSQCLGWVKAPIGSSWSPSVTWRLSTGPCKHQLLSTWGSGASLMSTICQSSERSIIGLSISLPAESLLEVRVLHSDCLFLVDLFRMGPTVRLRPPDRRSHNT